MTRILQITAALMSGALGTCAAFHSASSNDAPPQPRPLIPLVDPISPELGNLQGKPHMNSPPGRSSFLPIILREAKANDLPPAIVDAVIRVESFYNPAAVGTVGEIGLMQVRPSTAAMIGFKGTIAELADPETNIRYGVRYLARAWRLAKGDLCIALMKYRAGHGTEQMSTLSNEYCRRARRHLAATWPSFVADVAPDATVASDREAATPESPSSQSIELMSPDPSKGSGTKAATIRSAHWLIAASRAQSAAALRRVSAQSRSQEIWAAHAARNIMIGKQRRSASAL